MNQYPNFQSCSQCGYPNIQAGNPVPCQCPVSRGDGEQVLLNLDPGVNTSFGTGHSAAYSESQTRSIPRQRYQATFLSPENGPGIAGWQYGIPWESLGVSQGATISAETPRPHSGSVRTQASPSPFPATEDGQRQRSHSAVSSLQGTARHYQCRWEGCGTQPFFGREADLLRHLRAVHISPGSFVCTHDDCWRVFNRRDNLDTHISRNHRVRGAGRSRQQQHTAPRSEWL